MGVDGIPHTPMHAHTHAKHAKIHVKKLQIPNSIASSIIMFNMQDGSPKPSQPHLQIWGLSNY